MKPTTATSKFGKIRFEYKDSDDPTINRGWVVDVVRAYLDDKEIGYLKISYVTEESVEKLFPTPIHYKGRIGGKNDIGGAIESGDKKELVRALSKTIDPWDEWIVNLESRGQIKDKNDEWWDEQLKRLVPLANKEFKKQYDEFIEHWVNKPLVDYIKVENDYLSGGVGYGLYIAGAKWMAEKGMVLFASSLQSSEAVKAWDRMKRLGMPIKTIKQKKNKKVRSFLDYRK